VIGLGAAVLLFCAAVWLLVDGWYAPERPIVPRRARAGMGRLGRVLAEAELGWSPRVLVLASAGLLVLVFAVVFQAMGWLVPSLFAAGAAGLGPLVYVLWRREGRAAAKEEALVVALERAQEELRTVTIQEMLVSLARTAPAAVQPAFQRLAWDLEHQRDFADALRASQVWMGSRVWDTCVASLLLAHTVGERNLRATFGRIASNARADVQLRRAIRSQQAQHITSARITLVVPIAVVLFLRAAYPAADRLYASGPGELILLGCGICMLFGYWSMLRLAHVPRPPRAAQEDA
jgi:tight adherence protein B